MESFIVKMAVTSLFDWSAGNSIVSQKEVEDAVRALSYLSLPIEKSSGSEGKR